MSATATIERRHLAERLERERRRFAELPPRSAAAYGQARDHLTPTSIATPSCSQP